MTKRSGSVILVARYAMTSVDAPASSDGSPGSSPLLPNHAFPCEHAPCTTSVSRTRGRPPFSAMALMRSGLD
jgi:hypothetical protein